ncbi:unnamed protein product [Soboliphyme baturini]|uniref:UV-stimulated scaffold protein A n=1 Tax=Soboliphyme baturini TaxID=241478 RepID=A0A183IBH6_9BILA|nr:unnamed protein product [Soboliphyme baturini]
MTLDSPSVSQTAFDLLLGYVKCGSVARRLNAVRVIDYLFGLSRQFRMCTIEELPNLITYTLETDPLHHPVPGRLKAREELKSSFLKILLSWHEKYGSKYGQLHLAHEHLKRRLKIHFDGINLSNEFEVRREREAADRHKRLELKLLERVKVEFSELESDINSCLSEMNNGIRLLVPLIEDSVDVNGPSTSFADCVVPDSVTVALNVKKTPLYLTEDNADLVNSLRDTYKLMVNDYQPKLKKWLKTASKYGSPLSLMRRLTDFSNTLSSLKQKFDDLNITTSSKAKESSDDDDCSDFQEVSEKEGLEMMWKPPDDVPQYILNSLDVSKQPSSLVSTESSKQVSVTDNRPAIPVVSYGLDLKYWNKQNVEAPLRMRNDYDCHRFWRPIESDDTCQDEDIAAYRERIIEFTGKFEPVLHECRAPLKNGKLCPRKDRVKCPLHGLIIPRNEEDFLQDLTAGTGIDFLRNKKRKTCNTQSTRRNAIRKKVLNVSSLKRVGRQLDSSQSLRNYSRFRDQWNYY